METIKILCCDFFFGKSNSICKNLLLLKLLHPYSVLHGRMWRVFDSEGGGDSSNRAMGCWTNHLFTGALERKI